MQERIVSDRLSGVKAALLLVLLCQVLRKKYVGRRTVGGIVYATYAKEARDVCHFEEEEVDERGQVSQNAAA